MLPGTGIVSPSILVAQPAKYSKFSATCGKSTYKDSRIGLPLSCVSSSASSLACCSINCESLYSMRPRSRALILDHLPSRARRAAATALSISALSASATSASVSPVDGFGVEKVLPDSASTHCPSINNWYFRGTFASAGCAVDIMTPRNHLVISVQPLCSLYLRGERLRNLSSPQREST